MEKMNMLNDEELEKVVGGTNQYSLTGDGRVKIWDNQYCACENIYYFVDRRNGKTGLQVMGNLDVTCFYCKYYKSGYCTNPDFIAKVTG